MDTVQLSLHNIALAGRLEKELQQLTDYRVLSVKSPDLNGKGLVILDEESLDALSLPLAEPERFLLVTRNEGPRLKRAWEQGILSVVFEHDPVRTICLAAQAAILRMQNPQRTAARCAISPKSPITATVVGRTPATSTGPVPTGLKNQAM